MPALLAWVMLLQAAEPKPVSVRKIWDQAPHSAFTDLIRFRERWFCTFREADDHVGGDGRLRLLESADGEAWTSAGLIAEEGIDLRDPKLSVTPDGRLMIVAGGSVYKGGKKILGRQPRVAFSRDGRAWTETRRVLSEGEWLWRVTWHEGKAYGVSYNASMRETPEGQSAAKNEGPVAPGPADWKLKLFASADGVAYDLVTHLDVRAHPSEATLRFAPDGEMVALVRRVGGAARAWIGTSRPPYKEWTWNETQHQVGGPNFILLSDGSMWAGGRTYPGGPKTVLARMTHGSFVPALTLPSGGDNSYPGFVWHEGLLWMSYYSSHEGKASIYLAKIKLPSTGVQEDGRRIGTPLTETRVPALFRQGVVHAAQAVAAVDPSADGRVAVATLAFRHDQNFWVLAEDGTLAWGRTVLPWAPFQAAALPGGKGFGAGMAYSRVTGPHPTISLFGEAAGPETVLEDSAAEVGWLRYGGGDWKTGWTASLIGDLLLKSGTSLFTVSGHNGPVELTDEGQARKAALPHPRPFRMAASADGRRHALGYVAGSAATRSLARVAPCVLVVRDAANPKEAWSVEPLKDAAPPAPLPEPARDFPEFAETFSMRPDAVAPFRVAASVAANGDGSRVALTEYGGWLWIRKKPAIGRWDPPFHVIPFVPRQKGWLRVFDGSGRELAKAELPREGLFEVRTDRRGETLWCAPMSWFARGLAGCAWMPADEGADAVVPFDVARGWGEAWRFPDAVADLAVHPTNGSLLVSCWDGGIYHLGSDAQVVARQDAGSAARVRWSADGRWAVAGTESGEVLRLDAAGKLEWRRRLPVQEPPPFTEALRPVFEGIPIYRVGRTGPEHAYVGDIWLVKTEKGGVLVDAGGTSSVSLTLQKIRAAGVDPQGITHVLQTHSHGDHAGGAYLWRTRGARIVAPETAAFALAWVMPMLTDYGIWVPRPLDVPLPLKRAGDEAGFDVGGLRVRAIFVPGHSYDSVVYAMELGGKRVAFTGDMGFLKESHILHRCWGDAERAKVVVRVVREKVLPFKPDVVLTGHDEHRDGVLFLEDLVRRTEEALLKVAPPK